MDRLDPHTALCIIGALLGVAVSTYFWGKAREADHWRNEIAYFVDRMRWSDSRPLDPSHRYSWLEYLRAACETRREGYEGEGVPAENLDRVRTPDKAWKVVPGNLESAPLAGTGEGVQL